MASAINYLELFRQQCWGKRDLWGWIVGVVGLMCLICGPQLLFSYERALRPLGWVFIGGGVVGLCFWWGLKYARLALCAASTVALFAALVVLGNKAIWAAGIQWISVLFLSLLGLLLLVFAPFSLALSMVSLYKVNPTPRLRWATGSRPSPASCCPWRG